VAGACKCGNELSGSNKSSDNCVIVRFCSEYVRHTDSTRSVVLNGEERNKPHICFALATWLGFV
jgi:hypothetical protein